MSSAASWLRVALIDLRGSVRRFLVLISCVALGVGTIAAVGSVGAALQAAIDRDARVILGGDMEVAPGDADATDEQRAAFEALGTVARVVDLNTRAASGDTSVFVSLQAVGDAYPLIGALTLAEPQGDRAIDDVAPLLAQVDGVWGAVVDPQILVRLGVSVGDRLRIGDGEFAIRGALAALPDQAGQSFQLGLPALVSDAALVQAGLDQPGVLTQFRYKILLDDITFADAEERLEAANPGVEWRIRSPQDATEDLERFFDLFARFLVLVGLSSLLVGGVGVSNAVAAYVTERQSAIATLRSLGATRARIMVHFLFQVMVLGLCGVLAGLALGALSTLVALPILSVLLSIDLPPQLDVPALATAAGFGVLIAFAFSLLPLRRAQTLRPAALFRAGSSGVADTGSWRAVVGPGTVASMAFAVAGIAALALVTTGEADLVFWYGLGAVAGFAVLRGAAALLQAFVRRLPPLPNATLRQAVRALHRPGAPAPIVLLSLGLGLALLLMITLLDANIRGQLAGAVATQAPDFILIDMSPDDAQAVAAFVADDESAADFDSIPMLRGTIEAVAGRAAADIPREGTQGILRGDTPLSWAQVLPEASTLVEGEWWPEDYSGAPLVSLDADLKEALDLEIGDTLTINIAGRPLETAIANFRAIDWRNAGFNFRILVSPGLVESAPQTVMGSLYAVPAEVADLETRLGRAFPSLTFVPVGEVLNRINGVLGSLSNAVALVGSLAVISGVLVLAGAISVGRRQREADAMVMKVLGATRGDVIRAYVVEYGVLGAFSALLAILLGISGAWAILTYVLEVDFVLDWTLVIAIAIGATLATIVTGMLTTWSALSVRPARQLRAEGL